MTSGSPAALASESEPLRDESATKPAKANGVISRARRRVIASDNFSFPTLLSHPGSALSLFDPALDPSAIGRGYDFNLERAAGFGRLGTVNEIERNHFSRTIVGAQAAAFEIDAGFHQSGRRPERLGGAVLSVVSGRLHEIGPDRQSGASAFEAELAIVVETNPDYDQQARGESGEPAVVRGSGFARGRELETAGADARGRSAPHHFLQHVDHQKGDAWIEYAAGFRL